MLCVQNRSKLNPNFELCNSNFFHVSVNVNTLFSSFIKHPGMRQLTYLYARETARKIYPMGFTMITFWNYSWKITHSFCFPRKLFCYAINRQYIYERYIIFSLEIIRTNLHLTVGMVVRVLFVLNNNVDRLTRRMLILYGKNVTHSMRLSLQHPIKHSSADHPRNEIIGICVAGM